MTCTDCIDRDTPRQPSTALSLALILLIVGGIAAFGSATGTPVTTDMQGASATEDWHGNVRASGWAND